MATGDTRTASDAGMLVRAWQREAAADPEGFWARAAHQLPWFRPWERVIVLSRTGGDVPLHEGRDIRWEDFLALGEGQDATHATMEANEPAYILATSGTTARPKLAVHTHGPYQVLIRNMGDWVFGMQPADMWWSTSDIGWVVGHSYIVYAPLLVGCTTIAYEGALDHPGPETFYRIVAENRVTGVFTSPTAVRLLMRYGNDPAKK